MAHRRAMLQGTLAFVAALTGTILWHELGHGVTARILGYHPVVYSGHEEDPATTTTDSILIAAAGPLLSLVTGVVLLVIARRRPPGVRPGVLVLSWLGLLGMETFAGYLLTAPFFRSGDIGLILDRLDAPFPMAVIVAVVGAVATVGVALIAVGVFARLMPTTPARPTDLRLFLRQAGVVPWLIGVVLFNVAALPLDNPFGPLATATSGLFTLVAMGLTSGRFAHLGLAHLSLAPRRVNTGGFARLLVLTLALLLLDRLVFRGGLSL